MKDCKIYPLVSVIIPVCNASATLPACLKSLSEQTYKRIEYIFVDDGSVDDSQNILDEFAEKNTVGDRTVKVLHHEQNRGVAAARNTALDSAMGEYIYYVDADDTVASEAVSNMVDEALTSKADIVGIEWFLAFSSGKRYMRQPSCKTPLEALQKMMSGVMRWNLWLFLAKRSIYAENGIRFIEDMNMGEDMMVMMKLFACAKQISMLHSPFYYYSRVGNDQSLTQTYSAEHVKQVTTNVYEVEHYLQNIPSYDDLKGYVPFLKLNIKLPLLVSDNDMYYRQWTEWFPETNKYVMCNKYLPLRTRLLQWAAAHQLFFLLKLYYWSVFRFVYGVLYR
ncbi:MAG: glycosyltransferase [Prevotellaceae bacterium]|nr:glycosyltransferase [Prevotellaceae bacterium]